ncbi:toll/interleukin-1 receptor domain-containing protein [Mucilaginibacter gotjawali]|uniref:Lipoprotein NlpI n=2 Tax=Mucilaginibacter gotjawali TaxID=1550579 RepID=A0A110AZY9_9SPHI|nr:toll/interleukin-1 receptor domain-containing protein [Mucilaginibacter gotjawali]MBB3058132.1 tetratricopeptide (TPR) repeat protein [Mucilaginibacter gotjawali]BAU52107.1 lipoprotein NlpI [Mucilaginibacter gotjawali]
MADNLNPNIFLSYCWANVSIADEIDNDFKRIGIQFKRDVRDLTYRNSIKEFMQQVGKSDFVLMIISDEYLRSENCMYEVMELLNTHEFEKRILPIIIDNATRIFKPINQATYYEYWTDKKKDAEKFNRKHGNEVSIEYFKKCRNIEDNLPKFFQIITDFNASSFKRLKDGNYRDLLNIIGFSEELLLEKTIQIGNIEDAEERELALDVFLKNNPNNKYGLFQKAYLAIPDKHYKKAKKYFEDAIKVDSKFATGYYNLGILLESYFGDYKGAKINYEKAIENDQMFTLAHNNLALNLQEHFSDFEGAKFHFNAAIKIDPSDKNLHYNLANLLTKHFSDFKSAIFHYEEGIKIDPKFAFAHNNLGLLRTNYFSDFDQAKIDYENAIKIDVNFEAAHFNLAKLLTDHLLDFKKAKFHYNEVIRIDPKHPNAYNNLAVLLEKHFLDFEGAKHNYQKALKIDPKNEFANFNLAVLLASRFSDFENAKFHYNEVLKINPNDNQTHIRLAILLGDHFNDFQGAEFHFQESLKIKKLP